MPIKFKMTLVVKGEATSMNAAQEARIAEQLMGLWAAEPRDAVVVTEVCCIALEAD